MQFNNPPGKIKNNMTTPRLTKSMGRSPLRLALLLIPLLFASFAVVQSVQAEPNEADLSGNVAEENDAISDLGNDIEAAVGQATNTPSNRQVMAINIKKSLLCAGGEVRLSGNVVVTFTQPRAGLVFRHSIKFEGFKGTAVAGGRKLEAKEEDLKFIGTANFNKVDEDKKEGRFGFEFIVSGPGLPASKPFCFRVKYETNRYEWREGKLTHVTWDKEPFVKCIKCID
jgi:hypothetical protein